MSGFIKVWALDFNKGIDTMEMLQRRSTSMIRDLENTASEAERIAVV